MFKTHLAIGFLMGLFSLKYFHFTLLNSILFLFLITIFSALPDIDHPKSKYGRYLWFLSIPISFIFKHRGFFHSIFPAVIGFFLLTYFNLNFLAWSLM